MAQPLAAEYAAGAHAGSPRRLATAVYIGMPRGRWSYRISADGTARAVGATQACTASASVQ